MTHPGGRPSSYTEEIAIEICARLAEGESLRSICSADGMPNKATVLRWAISHPEFRDHYARAREIQVENWAEEIIEIADDGSADTIEDADGNIRTNHDVVQRSRLRVDTRKWLMSKLLPKKYGDRLTLGGDENAPLKTVTRIELVAPDDNGSD